MPVTIRSFEQSSGIVQWETTLVKDVHPVLSSWSIFENNIVSIEVLKTEGEYQLTKTHYLSSSGVEVSSRTTQLSWFTDGTQCDFANSHLACLHTQDNVLHVISTEIPDSHYQISLSEHNIKGTVTGVVKNRRGAPLIWVKTTETTFIFRVTEQDLILLANLPNNLQLIDDPVFSDGDNSRHNLAFVTADQDGYSLRLYDVESENLLTEVVGRVKIPDHFGTPDLLKVFMVKKKSGEFAPRYLLSTSDAGIIYGGLTELYWFREESLASITNVEMVDLPVSAMEASIDEEFTSSGGVFVNIFKRLTSQAWQLTIMARDIVGKIGNINEAIDVSQNKKLVRDRFGLHKLLIIVTRPGKIFAMDTLTGRIVWQRLLREISMDKLTLFIQRTSIHYPLEPQCTILAKKDDGSSVLFVFQPLTGQPIAGDGYVHLNYTVQQAILIPQSEETEFLKPLLMLDSRNNPHVFPETGSALNRIIQLADSLFLFTADPKTCVMAGYSLSSSRNEILSVVQMWQLNICSSTTLDNPESGSREEIRTITARHPEEKVHSQGRVLADRSVLYKYLNPNMVVVTTEGWHPHHRGYFNVYLVDVVSGSVIFSVSHRRVTGPVHVVYAENWIVYSYYNDKFRRSELASLELFEGKVQSNSSAFSSFTAPQPLVDRQAYIYPSHIMAMKDTFSEKGMTAKHILCTTEFF